LFKIFAERDEIKTNRDKMSINFSQALMQLGIQATVQVAVQFKDERARKSAFFSIFEAAKSTNISIPDEIEAYVTIPLEKERVMMLSKMYEGVRYMGPREMRDTIAFAKSLGVSPRDISLILLKFGYAGMAVERAESIRDERERVEALWPISRDMMLRGYTINALSIAMKIPDTIVIKIRDGATRSVRYENAQERAFQKIIDAAKTIEDETRGWILRNMSENLRTFILGRALPLLRQGNSKEAMMTAMNEAIVTAEKIPDKEIREFTFLGIFEALMTKGCVDEALELAPIISDEELRGSIHRFISETLKHSVMQHISRVSERPIEELVAALTETIPLAEKIPTREIHDETLLETSTHFKKLGHVNKAARVAEKILDKELQWSTILDILYGLIQGGHVKEARKIASKISDEALRESALSFVSFQSP
jgi:hypothetical protein